MVKPLAKDMDSQMQSWFSVWWGHVPSSTIIWRVCVITFALLRSKELWGGGHVACHAELVLGTAERSGGLCRETSGQCQWPCWLHIASICRSERSLGPLQDRHHDMAAGQDYMIQTQCYQSLAGWDKVTHAVETISTRVWKLAPARWLISAQLLQLN